MLNEFTVGSYRGLQNLGLKDLRKVNIFVGPNNCGKTSILEAIILARLLDNTNLFMNTLVSRYHGFSVEFFESLFPVSREQIITLMSHFSGEDKVICTELRYEKEESVVVNDELEEAHNLYRLLFRYSYEEETEIADRYELRFEEIDRKKYSLDIRRPRSNRLPLLTLPCKFISFSRFDNSNNFLKDLDSALDNNLRQELIAILQIFDEHIINFELIGAKRIVKLFRDNGERPLTLYDFGNGMYKTFYIGMSALLAKDGILLIDEVEAGIHNKALYDFIAKILHVCEVNNVQLFMTTHSLEAIDVILEIDENQLDDLAVYHIRAGGDRTVAKRYSGEKLVGLRNEIGFDVR